MSDHYILGDNYEPIRCDDLIEWAEWFGDTDRRRVALTYFETNKGDKISVSTVFLGSDHAFGGDHPLLFETLVQGSSVDGTEYIRRCETFAQAIDMHDEALDIVAHEYDYNLKKTSDIRPYLDTINPSIDTPDTPVDPENMTPEQIVIALLDE